MNMIAIVTRKVMTICSLVTPAAATVDLVVEMAVAQLGINAAVFNSYKEIKINNSDN